MIVERMGLPRVANPLAQEYFELFWDVALLLGGDGEGGPPDDVLRKVLADVEAARPVDAAARLRLTRDLLAAQSELPELYAA